MQFLKKHYEKIILCAVLLGLAAAAISMGAKLEEVQQEVNQPIDVAPSNTKSLVALNLTADQLALAQVTNPPPVILSGKHNLFNPVTWRRKADGELLKILKTGPDALSIINMTPLYTVIAYERASDDGEIYYFTVLKPSGKKIPESAKKDEKTRSGLYILRGIKGAAANPTELQLEILDTQETVWISKGNPYKRVDGYTVEMKYEPESRVLKERANETFTLDSEPYKVVEITNDLVRVQSIINSKMTTIKWNGSP
jgi:hypothetical protein